MIPEPHFAQVALSVADMAASLRFYTTVLGLRLATGRYLAGPSLARIQGLDDPSALVWWLVNDQPFFQLELFQYASPKPAPRHSTWRACDIGYTRLAFAVGDLDAAVERAHAVGAPVLGGPPDVGGARRACVVDPTGIPVEIIEERPFAGRAADAPARFVALGASTASLAGASRTLVEVLGLTATEGPGPAGREHLWGLGDAKRDLLTARAREVMLEFAAYHSPAPAPRRDGFRINDHGILNFALGYRDWDEFNAAYGRAVAAGCRTETAPMGRDGAYDVSYVTDADGFSVELLYCPATSDRMLGFLAS